MPSVIYVPSRIGEGHFTDFQSPAAGATDNGKIWAWNSATSKFEPIAIPTTSPGGSTGYVQYYGSGGVFSGHSGFTYNGAGVVTLSSALVSPAWKPASDSATALQLQNSSGASLFVGDTVNGNFGIGVTPSAHLDVKSASDSRIGIIVRVYSASQSANMMEYRDSDNSVLSAVNRAGWGVGISGSPSYKIDAREVTNVQIARFAQGNNSYPACVQIDRPSSTRSASLILSTGGSYNWFAGLAYRSGGASNNYFIGTLSSFSPDSANAVLCLTTTGLAAFGQGTTVPTARVDIAASTTGAASIRVRGGVAPTTPNDGDLWYDGTNLKFRDGSTTRTITWT